MTNRLDPGVLIDLINKAFEGVKCPSQSEARELGMINLESGEVSAFCSFDNWQQIPDSLIEYHYCDLNRFGLQAMRFILPAYMVYAIKHPLSNVAEFIVYQFAHQQLSGHPKFMALNYEQVGAIVQFLDFLAADYRMRFSEWDPHGDVFQDPFYKSILSALEN